MSRKGALPEGALVLIACCVMALSAMAFCGYRWGADDQAQYIVQLIAIEHPGVFAGDPYADVFSALGSIFWWPIAWLTEESTRGIGLATLTFVVSLSNALLLYAIGRTLLAGAGRARWLALIFPLLFVVPKELNWFGVVSLSDLELTASLGVMPFVFGAILLFLRERHLLSFVCCALAFPVHGQTGAYLLCAWWFACAIESPQRPRLRLALLAAALAGGGALLGATVVSSMGGAKTQALGAIGRGLYPALIEPLSIIPRSWAGVAIVLTLGALAFVSIHRTKEADHRPPAQRLLIWLGASLVFSIGGVLVHAIGVEHPLLWRIMVGRSLMLPQIACLLAVATWAAGALRRSSFGAPRAMLVVTLIAFWPLPTSPEPIAAMLGLVMFVCIGIDAMPVRTGTLDVGPRGVRRLVPLALGVVTFAGGVIAFASRDAPWLERDAPDAWVGVQDWARRNTPPGSMFLTPPHLSGWRIGSHRPTYVEARDGGLLFYKDDHALAWGERMLLLGVDPGVGCVIPPAKLESAREGYARAIASRHDEIVRETGANFVVLERDGAVDAPSNTVWANETFVVIEVGRPQQMADHARERPVLPSGS